MERVSAGMWNTLLVGKNWGSLFICQDFTSWREQHRDFFLWLLRHNPQQVLESCRSPARCFCLPRFCALVCFEHPRAALEPSVGVWRPPLRAELLSRSFCGAEPTPLQYHFAGARMWSSTRASCGGDHGHPMVQPSFWSAQPHQQLLNTCVTSPGACALKFKKRAWDGLAFLSLLVLLVLSLPKVQHVWCVVTA